MTHNGVVDAATRVVRVRTEVAAVAKTFDYAVPPGWGDDVHIGTRVRAPFHGRTVRGWVVDEDVGTPAGVDLLPLKSWLGWGPPAGLVDLAEWAAWRWAGPASFFLRTASPDTIVRTLPATGPRPRRAADGRNRPAPPAPGDLDLAQAGLTVVRQPPLTDPIELVLSVVGDPGVRGRAGSVLVLVPSTGWAERLTARLERRGCPTAGTWEQARAGWPVVVGNRAGAWAPVPRLAAVVVLDAHDAAYREESAPTYSAVDVLVERARRESVACLLVSPVPPVALAARAGLRTVAPPRPWWSGRAGPSCSGSTAAAPIRAAGCSPTSSSAWPGRPSTNRRRVRAAPWSASTTARAARVCWPAGTAASWPAVPAAALRQAQPRGRRCCAARGATRPVRSCARPAVGCA